ncbi:hypothetical protein [Methylocystis heyeri]|uniref:Uncharacterized protein n=1 Tax=Methylocystis heyeri TaxID=391905 RepID=A0A6B8KEP5_9HYPH|nr:hypothetical protein [Methylocystis heyeri]QGM46099.1 hypothetical protein H2LOC_010570 [Methylocystis heyeri]
MTKRTWLTLSLLTLSAGQTLAIEYPFDLYRVSGIYSGKVHYPDFAGRERKFAMFRTRIRQAAQQGINFAGHYAIVQFGCGTMCSAVYMTDIANGRVYTFPLGGEETGRLELKFASMSSLIVAHWNADFTDGCTEQRFVWRNERFDEIANTKLDKNAACWTDAK